MTTVTITIDGREVKAQAGQTVMDAAEAAGFDIPKLCHHPAIKPIGACRMCLVEIEKQRTLQPACTFPVSEGLIIHTESPKAVEARKFVLNLLFSERNHFCMFCQMSNNCELQDMAYRYKMDQWIYNRGYPKMPVDSTRKYFVMDHNRCILCRRCVRVCGEQVGNHTLGLRQRGIDTMLTADMDVPFGESSCISCGSCLQVCPTGALMDRTSANGGIEEQVVRVKTTCQFCSVGCGMELIVRDNHVIRVEGDWAAPVNKGLLCVKGRFEPLYEERKRATKPMVRKNGQLVETTWDEALQKAAEAIKSADRGLRTLVSSQVTNEAAALVAKVFGTGDQVGAMLPVPQDLSAAEGDLTALEEADLFVVVGADLTTDHPVAGYPVKRGVTNRGARLVVIDEAENGMSPLAYRTFKPSDVDKAIALAQGASQPAVIYGQRAGRTLAALREKLAGKAQFVGLVNGTNARGLQAAGLAHGADLSNARAVYALAADDKVGDGLTEAVKRAKVVIVQGAYKSSLMDKADVFLPTSIWSEKAGTLTNTEGRTQKVVAAVNAPAGVKSDEEVLAALAGKLGR